MLRKSARVTEMLHHQQHHTDLLSFGTILEKYITVNRSYPYYFTVLSCTDTVEVIFSDWRDTAAGMTQNMKI